MMLFRCLPWDESAEPQAEGGALWFPRALQGDGRHDAPARYGCLYVSEEPVSPVVEQLAPLAGAGLDRLDLVRVGLPLALAAVELADDAEVIDLDEPAVLGGEGLRPSRVATSERARSQADALALYEGHPRALGLRWWSAFDSRWANVTLFDRAAGALHAGEVRVLGVGDEVVLAAARFLGLRVAA